MAEMVKCPSCGAEVAAAAIVCAECHELMPTEDATKAKSRGPEPEEAWAAEAAARPKPAERPKPAPPEAPKARKGFLARLLGRDR